MPRALICGIALLLVGCTAGNPEPPNQVTYTLTTSLAAGSEAEHCKFVKAPADGMVVQRDEVAYTAGSHHFLLYETTYDEIPTTTSRGEPIEYLDAEQGVFDCTRGVQFDFEVTNLVGGSQNFDGDSMAGFPDGVGVRVRPGAVLLMNAHYINATPSTLEPRVDITLHTIPEEELEQEAGVLFWFDLFIKAPAQSKSHTTTRCPIDEDVTIVNAQSHMHARGVDYRAELLTEKGRTTIYENDRWEDVPVKTFTPGLDVAGGSTIEWTCFYDNPAAEDVYVGQSAEDEMCMFIASYYPARPETSLCSFEAEAPQKTNFMGAEWVGQGDASCAESLSCFQDAVSGPSDGPTDVLAAITDCVIASDPNVSEELSHAIGCTLGEARSGGDPIEACASAFAACSAK